jgi:host factor-I protein
VQVFRSDKVYGWGFYVAVERTQPVQDVFLKHLQEQSIPVTMFLKNGIKLQGYVTSFDSFCVLLTRDAQSQLVYKHAISSVDPIHPIQLSEES